MIKTRRMRWTENVACIEGKKGAYRGNLRERDHLGDPAVDGKHNIKILRCVIPVVLSNNNNKLLVHVYIVKNTTIFLIVRLLIIRYNYMFRPSMLAIFRLYMKHLTISYIYT